MKIAWKSTVCGHIFDKEIILKYIFENEKYGKVKCPIPGCSKMLRKNQFYHDINVQKEIDKVDGNSNSNSNNNRKRKRFENGNNDSNQNYNKKRRLNNGLKSESISNTEQKLNLPTLDLSNF